MKRASFILIELAISLWTVLVATAWLRSHYVFDEFAMSRTGGTFHHMTSLSGRLSYQFAPNCPFDHDLLWRSGPRTGSLNRIGNMGSDGIAWFNAVYSGTKLAALPEPSTFAATYTVPYWVPFVTGLAVQAISLTIPAMRWRRYRQRVRDRQCVRCGYDVRANPERCSECGLTATSEKTERAGSVRVI